MVNNKVKTATKITLILGLGLIGASFITARISKKLSQNKSITLDGSIIESMVFLKTTDDTKQLLPWNPQDGHQSVSEFYHTELKKHEDTLWQEATEKFGLNRDEFKKQLKLYSYDFKNKQAKRSGKLSPETIQIIEKVLKQCGLDPCTVEIVGDPKLSGSPAMATHTTILINEKEFKQYSPEGVRFIIAHETMHLKNQDGMAHGLLETMLAPDRNFTKAHKEMVNKFCRFQETRADIQAILTNDQFARGGVSFFKELMNFAECGTKKHPKNSDRIDLCQTVTRIWNGINNNQSATLA